ncbi:MAG: hypothetical protein JNK75_02885 [Betaproteobacteria bacterium]|nr:hypothetical protein [Betaproteobacteria bacterium]
MNANAASQVFLLEKDGGVLCRILGLYAARGIEIDAVDYRHAAPRCMLLRITAGAEEETLRVLVDKAGGLVGVIEAAHQHASPVRVA